MKTRTTLNDLSAIIAQARRDFMPGYHGRIDIYIDTDDGEIWAKCDAEFAKYMIRRGRIYCGSIASSPLKVRDVARIVKRAIAALPDNVEDMEWLDAMKAINTMRNEIEDKAILEPLILEG